MTVGYQLFAHLSATADSVLKLFDPDHVNAVASPHFRYEYALRQSLDITAIIELARWRSSGDVEVFLLGMLADEFQYSPMLRLIRGAVPKEQI